MTECDLTGQVVSSTAVFTISGGNWTSTANSSSVAIEDGICFSSSDGIISTGTVVVPGPDEAMVIPGPRWEWAGRVSGADDEGIARLVVDCCGRVYVTGNYTSTALTFYNADDTVTINSLPNSGLDDMFVAKMDTTGTWEWASHIASTTEVIWPGIAVDCCGNPYVCGTYSSSITFYNSDTSIHTSLSSPPSRSLFVTKLNTNGTWIWVAPVIPNSITIIDPDVVIDSCGDAYISAEYRGIANFYDADTLQISQTWSVLQGSSDVFIARITKDGRWQWVASMGSATGTGTDQTEAQSMVIDCCNNVYQVFRFNGAILTFSNADTTDAPDLTLMRIGTTNDLAIAKIDQNGKWLWSAQLSSPVNDLLISPSIDCCGNVYVTAQYQTQTITLYNADGSNSGISADPLPTGGAANDILVAKISSGGIWQWIATARGGESDRRTQIMTDCCGNSYLTFDYTSNPLFFFNADNSTAFSIPLGSGIGVGFAKINTDGNWLYALHADVETNDSVYPFVGIDCHGSAYFIGTYDNTSATFYDINNNESFTLSNSGGSDLFIAKLHNETSFMGISVGNNCAIFRGNVKATAETLDLPVQVNARYYYDDLTNKLVTACPQTGCCNKFKCLNCQKLSSCIGPYAIGLPSNEIYII